MEISLPRIRTGVYEKVSESPWAFRLLLVVLLLACVQPDRIIPGGRAFAHALTGGLLVLFLAWSTSWPKPLPHLQARFFLAFLGLMALHVLLARNGSWALQVLKTVAFFNGIPFLAIVQFLDNPDKLRKYVKGYFAFNIFIAVMGILGKGRVPLPILDDQNDFCLLMNIMLPIGYFLGQQARTRREKMFYYVGLLPFILANAISLSRGGFIGLVAVGLFMLYKSRRKLSLIVGAIFVFLTINILAPPNYWDRMETIQTENYEQGTGRSRVEFWKSAWKIFLDFPLLGVGPANFGVWLPQYFPGPNADRTWGRVAHSLPFTLLAEMGLFGTFFFAGMLFGTLRDYRYVTGLHKRKEFLLAGSGISPPEAQRRREQLNNIHALALSLAGALVAYLVTGLFISVLWYSYFWQLTALWVAIGISARQWERSLMPARPAAPLA